jgi:hypothetical protein
MTRLVAFLLVSMLGAALAFGPSLLGTGPAVAAEGSGSGSGVKVCKARTPDGKIKTWRCGKDQACCVNPMTNSYQCGIPGMGCL